MNSAFESSTQAADDQSSCTGELTRSGHSRRTRRVFRGRYKVLRSLGRGGFGITYLAKDISLPGHPLCVIKKLSPKIDNPAILKNACQRFKKEAEILARLGSHAQIPQLLDYFEAKGQFFLVQEYIRGANLADELKRTGPWSEAEVKQFLKELLPLVRYVHQNQVIHRDIKPQNIIRCHDDGRLVLIDFGAIKEQLSDTEGTNAKAPTTHFVGTIGFAPPEQLAMRSVFASDIYAIGLTCLYLLTGQTPLQYDYDSLTGETRWKSLVKVSDHFAKVLTKMLKISLAERYQSVGEIIRALNLEPYLDNLSPCLTTQPPASDAKQSQDSQPGQHYLTPIERTAEAIRDWRAKQKIRILRSNKCDPR
ncbi:serine/threonine protein kinase [Leptolyngbya sp. 'hensonii']|nr:serine/threonine protein kinase [Leptolyngbya sp. 'hensonii']